MFGSKFDSRPHLMWLPTQKRIENLTKWNLKFKKAYILIYKANFNKHFISLKSA